MNNIIEELKLFTDNLIPQIIKIIPNVIMAIVVFLIGLALAYLSKRLIKRFIVFLLNSLNKILKSRKIEMDLESSSKVAGIAFFWVIIIFTVALIAQILELNFIANWFEGLIQYLPNIIAALFIIFAGFIFGKIVSNLIVTVTSKIKVSNSQSIGLLAKYIILFVSVVIAVNQIGIDIAFLIYLILLVLGMFLFGAVLAFALGTKSTVSNIISSYYVQKTFHVGDTIQIRNTEGEITKITPTSVFLKTEKGQLIIPSNDFNKEEVLIIEE